MGGPELALEAAIQADDLETVRAALRNADVNTEGTGGLSSLERAMNKILRRANLAVMRELLAAGAKGNGDPDNAWVPLARASTKGLSQ